MLITNPDNKQIEVIQNICDMQIQSLIRVSIDCPGEEHTISRLLKNFDKLKKRPSGILMLDSDSNSLFKHNLMLSEDLDTRSTWKRAIQNIWRQLNINEYSRLIPS